MTGPMKKKISQTLFLFVVLTNSVHAEITVERLIKPTDIKESYIAMCELPRWSGVRKVVVQAGALDLARQEHSGIQFITARKSAPIRGRRPTIECCRSQEEVLNELEVSRNTREH